MKSNKVKLNEIILNNIKSYPDIGQVRAQLESEDIYTHIFRSAYVHTERNLIRKMIRQDKTRQDET